MAEPVAVPAFVPALDQHAGKPVFRREIDRLDRPLRRRAVIGTFRPAPLAGNHAPPDADILLRLEPADIAELVRLVEIEFEVAFHQRGGIVAHADGAPGRVERRIADNLGPAARARRQRRAEKVPVLPLQPVSGIIDQRGLVQRQVRSVLQPHRDRRVGGGDTVDRRFLVGLLVPVEIAAGHPPCRAFGRDVELGQLLRHVDRDEAFLLREFVAETDTVIEHAEAHVHQAAAVLRRLAEAYDHLVMVIAHEAAFAPGQFPRLVHAFTRFRADHFEAAHHGQAVGQQEAELGWRNQQLPLARHLPRDPAIVVRGDPHLDTAIGRRHTGNGPLVLRRYGCCDETEGCDPCDRSGGLQAGNAICHSCSPSPQRGMAERLADGTTAYECVGRPPPNAFGLRCLPSPIKPQRHKAVAKPAQRRATRRIERSHP